MNDIFTEPAFHSPSDHEADLRRINQFRPIDDTFMRVLMRSNHTLVEYVLQTITGIADLRLVLSETQKDLKSLYGSRGLSLDVYCVDDKNRVYDLEVQRSDQGAIPERARYHGSVLDVEKLRTNEDFSKLPETYIIFLTENDIFGEGKAVYRICRTDRESGQPFHDRQYIYYANASYQGSDAIGRLMHDFLCSDPDKMQTSIMAEAVRYYKNNPKGVATMCRLMEEMQKEYYHRAEDQTLLRSIRNIMDSLKVSAAQAMDILKISAKDQPRYLKLLNQ